MPAAYDQFQSAPKKAKVIKSAFDSETFDADVSIRVEGLVGSATISPSGRDLALASPEGLAIIDLDSPYSPPRRLSSHGSPWLVVDVQWSPFALRDYWVASTANHRCLIWNLNQREDSPSGAIEHSLQAHSRAITDINFSAHHADFLATCAVDGYVHCWDLRRPRRPAVTFCDWFAGATQVKYNRQNPHILASSHDRWLHIWDDRMPTEPLKTIVAHTSKIYGLDWNRTRETGVVTCSLDKSIKFWDYSKSEDVPQRVIRTDFPVWRARHTPFGWGLLAMPQNEPGNLYLYDRRVAEDEEPDQKLDPVAVFEGHGDHKVKEFLWRSRGGINENGIDNRDFQLVSWGEDKELRMHRVDPRSLESVGYVKNTPARNYNLTRKGAVYKTFRTVDENSQRIRRTATMSDPRPTSSSARRSALTSNFNTPNQRLGPSWKGPSMTTRISSGKGTDKSQVQIGWMRGITMTKRKASADSPGRLVSSDSGIFSPGFHDNDFSEPETVQEELIRISNTLPNVKWDHIDMDALILNASLKGPWGADDETIFIKVRLDIPSSYPKIKAPKFIIEKSSFLPEQTHKRIEREVQQLAQECLKRKRNCLDVVFTYLLGEVDLETSATFFKDTSTIDDEIDALADESSSDDSDNDVPPGGSATMSQELVDSTELDAANALAPTSRSIIPPPPRLCGARFSNDGRLVCFFPSKEEKAKAALFAVPDTFRERQKGEPNFAGFGRLTHEPATPRPRFHIDDISVDDRTDDVSDEDEGSVSSSSGDSEITTLNKVNLWYQPGIRFRKTWSAHDSFRSSGGGSGVGTGTGTGTGKKRSVKARNILSIHDFEDILPAKRQLAQEYAIFGDGVEVCEHNAKVAEKYGYEDLANVWKYSALLLHKGVPLEVHRKSRRRKHSVLVIAKDAIARTKMADHRKPGASRTKGSINRLQGRVRWGYHPLGKDFVADLFAYYESLADTQMLAMLSCIFGATAASNALAYAEANLSQPETPLPMKAPSFSLSYFPTDPTLWKTKSFASSAVTTPKSALTPGAYSHSNGSEDHVWPGDPSSNSYSCGETPPKQGLEKANFGGREKRLREKQNDPNQSLSTSPDNRSFRRANSVVSSTFTVSLPKTIVGMVSGSPPDPPTRKRASPAETILSNITSNIAWAGSTYFGGPNEPSSATTKTSASDEDRRREDRRRDSPLGSLVPVSVSVAVLNRRSFDDDGWVSAPLVEPGLKSIYISYRNAYGELLNVWGEPLARLEIQKFNLLEKKSYWVAERRRQRDRRRQKGQRQAHSDGNSNSNSDLSLDDEGWPNPPNTRVQTGRNSPVSLGLSRSRDELADDDRPDRDVHLSLKGTCYKHETQLVPLEYLRKPGPGAKPGLLGSCERCTEENDGRIEPQAVLTCVYCLGTVDGLFPPCLNCGCVSHEHCLAEWHAAGETVCPAGDECDCVAEAYNGQIESWAALRAAMGGQSEEDSSTLGEKRGAESTGQSRWGAGDGAQGAPSEPLSASGAAVQRARRRSVPAKLSALVGIPGNDEEEDARPASGNPAIARPLVNKPQNGTAGAASREDQAATSTGLGSLSALLSVNPVSHGTDGAPATRSSLGTRLLGAGLGLEGSSSSAEGSRGGRPGLLRAKSGSPAVWKRGTGF